MFEYYIWLLCFVSLYVSFFWMNVLYLEKPRPVEKLKHWPKVSFLTPAWNEERCIEATVHSLLGVDYPNFEVVVIDDESTDNTAKIVRSIKDPRLRLVANKHKGIGKASAVNKGISVAKGEYVAVVDSDCFVDPRCLKLMVPHLADPGIGAVMTPIKVKDPKTFLERMQRLEYILTSFTRQMMSFVNTVQVTPGALSLYRKDVVIELGGFDENNITEDFEMALRLHYAHYSVVMEPRIETFTYVPDNLKDFWKQRTRWFVGFIHNTGKYKDMIGSRDHGMMGVFQVPLNVLMLVLMIVSVILFVVQLSRKLQIVFAKLFLYEWNIMSLLQFPDSWWSFFLSLNVKLYFPLAVTLLCAVYLYHKAHVATHEKWQFPLAIFIYMFIYPFLRTAIWIASMLQVAFASKRRW